MEKYRELKGLCKCCLGCNRLENKWFEGFEKCKHMKSPQETVKEILGVKDGVQEEWKMR